MKTSKKVRGHKRLWKDITEWVESNRNLNEDDLFSSGRSYIKVPFSENYTTNSRTAEYKGKTRKLILEGLLDIYDQWKKTLDTIDEPYYLKIWLYDQRFSKSQVVCAIGDFLDFYDSTFHKPEQLQEIDLSSYGNVSERMKDLHWQYAFDEDHYNNTTIGEIWEYQTDEDYYKTKRWFKNRLKKPHRKLTTSNPDSDINEYYSFRRGTIWIGG